MAAQPQSAEAVMPIETARHKMVTEACDAVMPPDALAECIASWSAWADAYMPTTAFCQYHGAQVAKMPACIRAMTEGMAAWEASGPQAFATTIMQLCDACKETTLCGVSTLGFMPAFTPGSAHP